MLWPQITVLKTFEKHISCIMATICCYISSLTIIKHGKLKRIGEKWQ